MNNPRSIKLIKKAERKDRGIPIAVELPVGPKKWSTAVRSWVVEFQGRDQSPDLSALPTFDSLFRHGSAALGGTD